jgi:hypothetical protein
VDEFPFSSVEFGLCDGAVDDSNRRR